MSISSLTKTSLAAALALALGVASAAAADPTPAAHRLRPTILTDIGMKPSLDQIVPAMFAELERETLATHPELKEPLQAAVRAVTPEFVTSEQNVLNRIGEVPRQPDDRARTQADRRFLREPDGQEIHSSLRARPRSRSRRSPARGAKSSRPTW